MSAIHLAVADDAFCDGSEGALPTNVLSLSNPRPKVVRSMSTTAEQRAFYDTLRALKRNKRIRPRDARRFAYEASLNVRESARQQVKGGEKQT